MAKKGLALVCAALLLCGMATLSLAETTPCQLGDTMEDFSVTLSDGTETSLYGLLAERKAVLINFWAIGCLPCQQELPALQQAYDEVSGQIGMVALSVEAADTDEAILSMKEKLGLTTLPMGRDNGVSQRFSLEDIPSSVLVDRNGVVCFRHDGPIPDKGMLLRLFALYTGDAYAGPVLTDEIPAAAAEGAYVVNVTDEDGNPVPGVMLQICDDATCQVATTDDSGTVIHTGAPYAYEFHVLVAPEGFAADSTPYSLPAEGGTLNIVLKKQR